MIGLGRGGGWVMVRWKYDGGVREGREGGEFS